jgi:hypothetical protein
MIIAAVVITLRLIVLHTVDGREVTIAAKQITSLIAAKDDKPNELLAEPVRCVVNLVDGKFITVAETCSVVRQLIEESSK